MYSMNHIETRVEAREGHKKGNLTDSRERIIEMEVEVGSKESSNDYGSSPGGGIHRTVEFEFQESNTHAV